MLHDLHDLHAAVTRCAVMVECVANLKQRHIDVGLVSFFIMSHTP